MGYFSSIDLINFRNFENYSLNFSKNCNVFYGKNGSGKTNILEGISLLSKGRGLRKDKFANIIKKNCDKFIIKSDFKSEEITYNLIVETENINNKFKKKLSVNNDKSSDSLELINGKTPFLYFLPETERLFQSPPSIRRNLIDQFIYTSENKYNKLVNRYNKFIQERSKVLINNNNDDSWLKQLEMSISADGLQIYSLRENLLKVLINAALINKINRQAGIIKTTLSAIIKDSSKIFLCSKLLKTIFWKEGSNKNCKFVIIAVQKITKK